MKRSVVDASVILKWYLPDEELGFAALRLLDRFLSDELEILAPSLLEYELLNGLVVAQRRGRIREETTLSAVDGFRNLEMKLSGLSALYPKVLHYCTRYGCTAYDASYLAVADDEGVPLVTADRRLQRAVSKDLKWVRWLGEI